MKKSNESKTPKSYPTAETRAKTLQISGHFDHEPVKAFRILAARRDMDIQELMAESFNLVFEKHGVPTRMNVVSGRRKRGPKPEPK